MAASCGVCNLPCDDSGSDVRCSVCDKVFHQKCVKTIDSDTRRLRSWKCMNCQPSPANSSVKSIEATALTKEFLVKVLEDFKKEVFRTFRKELEEVTTSIQFLSNAVDTSNELMANMKKDYDGLKKENQELRETTEQLTSSVSSLQEKVRTLEQYTRKSNIEICGLPSTPGESIHSIVKDVGKALGLEVTEQQVNAAHRVPSFRKDRAPSIVVQFHARSTRDAWIETMKKKKSLFAHEVNPAYPKNTKLYVSEHLSPDNKQFLGKLKQKCRAVGIKFAWCRDGKFYARKAEGDKFLKIVTEDDINSLK